MYELNLQDVADVGGGMPWIVGWAFGQGLTFAVRQIGQAVLAGDIDYAGLAESQGSYYNMVGA